ncbi:MAG: hypothetical protein AAFR31_13435 [Cyanobacteria bacterium J06627_8]
MSRNSEKKIKLNKRSQRTNYTLKLGDRLLQSRKNPEHQGPKT